MDRRVENSSNFYKNVKEYYVTEILKQLKTIIYKEYLKLILTYLYKSQRWTPIKEDKSKIQEMNVKFFRRFLREKTRSDRISNGIFREETGVQNVLIELEGRNCNGLAV